jgi:TonB family protein
MSLKWIASLGWAAALYCTPVQGQALEAAPARIIHLDFQAEVQADGSLANVEPDQSLAPALQAMLRRQVAGWRYSPGTWQGTPVPKRISQRIVAEAMPGAGGGFALRIKAVGNIPVALGTKRSRMVPPPYPREAQRQGIEATMIYAIRRDSQGEPIDVELVDAQVSSNWTKQFDAASRQAIRQWRLQPVEVGGQVIDCRLLTPLTFRLGSGAMPPETDLRPYLPRFPDSCPLAPLLQTPVADVFL